MVRGYEGCRVYRTGWVPFTANCCTVQHKFKEFTHNIDNIDPVQIITIHLDSGGMDFQGHYNMCSILPCYRKVKVLCDLFCSGRKFQFVGANAIVHLLPISMKRGQSTSNSASAAHRLSQPVEGIKLSNYERGAEGRVGFHSLICNILYKYV